MRQTADEATEDVVGHGQQHQVGTLQDLGHADKLGARDQGLGAQSAELRDRVGGYHPVTRAVQGGGQDGAGSTDTDDPDVQPWRGCIAPPSPAACAALGPRSA